MPLPKGEDHHLTYYVINNISDAEKKKYYNGANLNVLTSQPSATRDVTASVLENNALGVTAAAEWETEWNNLGLKSRLSEEARTPIS